MLMIHAYIFNIGTYRKLKILCTKNFHPFVNVSSIINYQFISGKMKQKAILFTRSKTETKLNICFQGHSIKQYNCVEYLDCLLDSNLCGESMARKALKKIYRKLNFLYSKAIFLNLACKNYFGMPLFSHILITVLHHGIH